jgi:hypothetical protein
MDCVELVTTLGRTASNTKPGHCRATTTSIHSLHPATFTLATIFNTQQYQGGQEVASSQRS